MRLQFFNQTGKDGEGQGIVMKLRAVQKSAPFSYNKTVRGAWQRLSA